MPYQEQSPLAAAVGMAGGWLKGQQEAKQRALEQQQLQQAMGLRQAQLALEQKRDAANAAYQKFDMDDRRTAQDLVRGIDPKTGQPIMNEAPKSFATPVSPKASLQDQYSKNFTIGAWLYTRGFKDQAKPYLDAAANNASILHDDQMFQRDMQRTLVVANLETDRLIKGINARGDQQTKREEKLIPLRAQSDEGVHEHNRLFDVNHPESRAGTRGANIPTFNSVNSMLNEWSNGSQAMIGKNIASGTPQYARVPPTAAAKNAMYDAVTRIQQSGNPLREAAMAVAAYKKHFPGDEQGVRVLQEAGQQAAFPPAPPTP